MSAITTIQGPLLNPQQNGSISFHPHGALQWNAAGRIIFVGDATGMLPSDGLQLRSRGILLPPFLDCHIHIPQWPIRGKFCEGIVGNPPEGRLLAGLNHNVFPYEARCSDANHVAETVSAFGQDTLVHGVVGGAAFMTVHAAATATALQNLPDAWSVGLVLMNINCPQYLRTDEPNLQRDVESLAGDFGRRMILTDRFAVAVDSPLRQQAVRLAEKLGLRMQTHLNEQPREKHFVEKTLYPHAANYTDVYQRDGLLRQQAILAHCIHMSESEFDQVAAAGAVIAHCPTSNSLLGSGIMRLDQVIERGIPYAICTDVGASPTTSILSEIAQFLKVHAGRSAHATPSEALYRTTLAAAKILGLENDLGTFAVGRPASFIEIDSQDVTHMTADEAILSGLLGMTPGELANMEHQESLARLAHGGLEDEHDLDWITKDFARTTQRLDGKVSRVTINGRMAWDRPT